MVRGGKLRWGVEVGSWGGGGVGNCGNGEWDI